MARPHPKTRQNIPLRSRKNRSLRAAASWSILVAFGITIAFFIVALWIPGTAIYNFWKLATETQVSPNSELLQQLQAEIEREETLYVTPISLFFAGVTLGRLSPQSLPSRRVLFTASGVSSGIILACLVFFWGWVLVEQHGHFNSDEMDTQKAFMQMIASIGWIIAYVIGCCGGLLWRNAGRNRRSEPPSPTLTSASR